MQQHKLKLGKICACIYTSTLSFILILSFLIKLTNYLNYWCKLIILHYLLHIYVGWEKHLQFGMPMHGVVCTAVSSSFEDTFAATIGSVYWVQVPMYLTPTLHMTISSIICLESLSHYFLSMI